MHGASLLRLLRNREDVRPRADLPLDRRLHGLVEPRRPLLTARVPCLSRLLLDPAAALARASNARRMRTAGAIPGEHVCPRRRQCVEHGLAGIGDEILEENDPPVVCPER